MFKDANVTVMVSNIEKAIEFYTKTLGLKLNYRMGDDWAEIEAPRLNIGLHKAGESGMQPGQKGSLSIGFQVESLDDTIRQLKGVGVEFAPHRVDDREVRLAFFGDPDKNPLYLVEVKQPAQVKS